MSHSPSGDGKAVSHFTQKTAAYRPLVSVEHLLTKVSLQTITVMSLFSTSQTQEIVCLKAKLLRQQQLKIDKNRNLSLSILRSEKMSFTLKKKKKRKEKKNEIEAQDARLMW